MNYGELLILAVLSFAYAADLKALDKKIQVHGDYTLSVESRTSFHGSDEELKQLKGAVGDFEGRSIVQEEQYDLGFRSEKTDTLSIEIKNLKSGAVFKAEYAIGDKDIEMLKKEPATKEKNIVDHFNEFIIANILPPGLAISPGVKTYPPLKLHHKRNLAKDIECITVVENADKSLSLRGESNPKKQFAESPGSDDKSKPGMPNSKMTLDAVLSPQTDGYAIESITVIFSLDAGIQSGESKWLLKIK